jgi:hypothetical protein
MRSNDPEFLANVFAAIADGQVRWPHLANPEGVARRYADRWGWVRTTPPINNDRDPEVRAAQEHLNIKEVKTS